jgi:hypothetical protein
MAVKKRLLLTVLAVALTAAACGGSSKSSSPAQTSGAPLGSARATTGVPAASSATTGGSAAPTGTGGALGATVSPAGPKIITTADVTMQVKGASLPQVFSDLAGLATGLGGYISDSSTSFAGTSPSARAVLRVPAVQFQTVSARLASLGRVTSENISGQDVTTEVADNGAQLTTLQDEADAARTLLAKANSIGEILAIQDQVFALQSQIQQLSAQQAALAGEISYATVSVELTATPVPAPRPHRQPTASRTWHLAVSNSAAVLRGIVLTMGWLAPVLILAAIAALPWAVWRRRRQQQARPAASDT